MVYNIQQLKSHITPIAEQYGVDGIALFGSYVLGTATSESDIDLHIYPGNIRFLRICAMGEDIKDMLNKQVHIIVDGAVIENDLINDIKAYEEWIYVKQ